MNTIGILGCGKQAPKHISAIRKHAPATRVLVADIDYRVARKVAEQCNTELTAGPEELLRDSSLEAVVIATPTPSHFDLIEKALLAGKHVLCEKPLTETLEQAESLASTAKSVGRFVQVGYVYRQVPSFRVLHELLRETPSPFGKLSSALLRVGGRGSAAAWKHQRASGGGAISEMLVHMLDLALWLFGDISRLQFHQIETVWSSRRINGTDVTADAEDFVIATARSESGVPILLQADLATPSFRQYLEVAGETGGFIGSIQSGFPQQILLTNDHGQFKAGENALQGPSVNLFAAQMQQFLRNVESGRLEDAPGPEDSIALLSLLNNAIYPK